MKRFCSTVSLAFMVLIAMAAFAFAQKDADTETVFDLGDVLVIEKSGEVSQATTTDVVSVEDIEQTGAETVADVLDQVPGIDIQLHPKSGPTLKMRGFDQEDVKILIDGVPAHESYDGYLDLGMIPVDSVAKIEITKGASSVLYGANTMGGVINIITKKGGIEPFTKVTTSFGENSTRNFIANHGGSKGKFNYWLTGSYRDSDGWDVSDDFDPDNPDTGIDSEYMEDGGTRDLSYYTYKTLNAKLGYEYDTDSRVYLSFDYHDNERGCPTFGDRYWAFDEWKQWHLNLVGEHDMTNNITLKSRLFYVKHDDTLEDVSWDEDHSTDRKWFERSSYDDYSVGGEVQTYIDISDSNLLKFGATYLKDHHKQQDYLDEECFGVQKGWDEVGLQPQETYEADIITLAAEDEMTFLNDRLTLIGGFSYDIHEPKEAHDQPVPGKDSSFNPQIGAVYAADPTLKLHGSVGKKIRFPQLKELYSEMAGGNPDLEAQEAIVYELGASKKFTDSLEGSVALFYDELENKITTDEIDDERVYVNKGEGTNKGVEVTLDYMFDFNLETGISYTYVSSKEKEDASSPELESEYTPEHKATLDVRYWTDFGLNTSFQCIYNGEQIKYDDDDEKVTIDDFYLINARVAQKLTMFEVMSPEVFLEIENLLDEDYEEDNGPMPGRTCLLGVSFTF